MRFVPFPNEQQLEGRWQELGMGAPTIIALANLCGRSLIQPPERDVELGAEAKAILVAARQRGVLELKGINTAFESFDRLLAVHVETEPERGIVFRSRTNPEFTIRCLEAFRQPCAAGLILHHLYRDFSLSQRGYELARKLDQA